MCERREATIVVRPLSSSGRLAFPAHSLGKQEDDGEKKFSFFVEE